MLAPSVARLTSDVITIYHIAMPEIKQKSCTAGAALKAHRTEAALSQRRLAELSGISQRQIAYIESGRGMPRSKTWSQLSAVLTELPDTFEVRMAPRS
jgi:predicted transcriptional regulator